MSELNMKNKYMVLIAVGFIAAVNTIFLHGMKEQNIHLDKLVTFTANKGYVSASISDNKLIMASEDQSTRICDFDSGELLCEFPKCVKRVGELVVQGDDVIYADKNTVKIWQISSDTLLATLEGHNDYVNSVAVQGNKVASASQDGTVKLWNLTTKELLSNFNHSAAVSSVTMQDNILVAGLDNGRVNIWNMDTGDLLHVLEGYDNNRYVWLNVIHGDKLFTRGAYDRPKVWDVKSGKQLYILPEPELDYILKTRPILIQDNLIIAANNKFASVFDINTGEQLYTLEGEPNDCILSMAIYGDKLVLGLYDSVKIWDLTSKAVLLTQKVPYPLFSLAMHENKLVTGEWNEANLWALVS